MSDSNNIICPKCDFEIEVTEVLSAQLRAEIRKEFEAEQRKKEAQLVERETSLQRQIAELKQAKAAIDEEVAAKLSSKLNALPVLRTEGNLTRWGIADRDDEGRLSKR